MLLNVDRGTLEKRECICLKPQFLRSDPNAHRETKC